MIRVRFGSLGRHKGSSGSLRFALIYLCAHKCRRVHLGSRRFTQAHLEIIRFPWFHSGTTLGFGVHSGSPRLSRAR